MPNALFFFDERVKAGIRMKHAVRKRKPIVCISLSDDIERSRCSMEAGASLIMISGPILRTFFLPSMGTDQSFILNFFLLNLFSLRDFTTSIGIPDTWPKD